MSKNQTMNELTNLLVKSLRHKIGATVNENEFYANKYSRDFEVILKQAEKTALKHSWSKGDKREIKKLVRKKLRKELEEKEFINNKKFEVMDAEVDDVLKELELN